MKHAMMFAAIAVVTLAVQANPTQVSNGVMASKEGKTLYTFDKDAAGKSNCNGGCAAAWPPFMVANVALAGGDFSIRQTRRRRLAMGVQGQAAVLLRKRCQSRRCQRRQAGRCMARASRRGEEDIGCAGYQLQRGLQLQLI